MTDFVLPRSGVTARFAAVLDDISPAHPVGRGAPPRVEPDEQVADPPYFVLRSLWVTIPDEGWGASRHSDVRWTYQIDSVALKEDQLEWMRDKLIHAVLGKTAGGVYLNHLDDTGVARVIGRELSDDELSQQPTAGVFSSSTRFVLLATRDT